MNNTLNKEWSLFKDKEFSETRKTLDAEMRLSAREGNVKPTKRSLPISIADENELWRIGSLGSGSPKQLQNTLIYVLSLELGLRAANELKSMTYGLASDELKIAENDGEEKLFYKENSSKTRHFGFKQAKQEPKCVTLSKNVTNPERCPIFLFKKFLHHRPNTSKVNSLFLSPIDCPKSDIWYKQTPLGIHQIEKVTSNLMKSVGKSENFTNTSLRRTGKTRMLSSGIPNEVTKQRIGHVSNADQAYIHVEQFESKSEEAIRGQAPTNSGFSSAPQAGIPCTSTKSAFVSENLNELFSGKFEGCTFNVVFNK